MKHYLMNPTWRCQNRCEYCWMQKTVAKRAELYTAIERPVEDWYEALKRDRPELVDIAGGEPLLVDWVPELMRACSSIRFGLSTNGLSEAGVDDLCRSKIANLIAINVSYHPSTAATNYLERWKDTIIRLGRAGYAVHSNVVRTADNLAALETEHLAAWFARMNMPYEVSPYEEVSQLGGRRERGLVCKGGVNHLTIAPDGTAWPCLTTLRSPEWFERALGNWLDGTIDFRWLRQPCYLECVDYYVLAPEHPSGDVWGVEAKPVEQDQADRSGGTR